MEISISTLVFLFLGILLGYLLKSREKEIVKYPKIGYVTPSLESISIRAKYRITGKTFLETITRLSGLLKGWSIRSIAEGYVKFYFEVSKRRSRFLKWLYDDFGEYVEGLKNKRSDIPMTLHLRNEKEIEGSFIVDVECLPTMYYKMQQHVQTDYTEQEVEGAARECSALVEDLFVGVLKAETIQKPSTLMTPKETELKSRLRSLGLMDTIDCLDSSEENIKQNDFEGSITSSRTALEKMTKYFLNQLGLEETYRFKSDLDRLSSKGYISQDTQELLQKIYEYQSLSGVHRIGSKPNQYEAELFYHMTMSCIEYMLKRLSY